MQPPPGSIRAFFKPASKVAGVKRASGGSAAAPTAAEAPSDAITAASEPVAAAGDPLPPPPTVFARKRRRPSGGGSAAAAAGVGSAAAAADAAGGGAAPASAAGPSSAQVAPAAAEAGTAAGSRPRQLTQMYLDVGQRNFHAYRCPTCGMLYARGTDADERLHAAFHASATQGPRYQGWAGERVVQLDGSKGRVLLFGSADQGRPRKVPLTVLLYVSAARRVQGFVAAEAIKEAYCARPSLPPAAAQGMLSCGSAVQPASGSRAAHAAGAAAAAPLAGQPVAAAAAAQAHVATSGRSLLSVTLSTGAAAAECSSRAAIEGAGGGGPAAAGAAAAEAGDGEGAAAAGCTPGLPTSPHQQQDQQLQQQQAQQQAKQQQTQQQVQQQVQQQAQQQAPQPPALPPLELDRSRRVRTVCGVRLMWVSLEARRRGLASRLLDCCRSHFMPGYVLPRHELAFSAPTDDGRAFIEQYAGSRKFLVYE